MRLSALSVSVAALLAFTSTRAVVKAAPLDDYVYRDDGAFSITDLKTEVPAPDGSYVAHFFNFTSQKWLTPKDSSRPVWWHILAVIIPKGVDTSLDSSYLYINGGSNEDSELRPDGSWKIPSLSTNYGLIRAASVAVKARTTSAVLFDVPNQPIAFPDDPWHRGRRTEDGIIAYTWWKYATSFDPKTKTASIPAEWLLQFPMTKAGVKALDALQIIIPKLLSSRHVPAVGGSVLKVKGNAPPRRISVTSDTTTSTTNTSTSTQFAINKFIVSGCSKRGWTTWLVGAVEAGRSDGKGRVAAIIPMVLDLLDVSAFMHRQFSYYDGFSNQLQDYIDANITIMMDSAQLDEGVFLNVDPLLRNFRNRYQNLPKFVISAGGDQFLMPDDHRFIAPLLFGETHFLLVKNADHSLGGPEFDFVVNAVTAYVYNVQRGGSRPKVTWGIDENSGRLFVATDVAPESIDLIYSDTPAENGEGTSPNRRDFRWMTLRNDSRTVPWFTEKGADDNADGQIIVTSPTSFNTLMEEPSGNNPNDVANLRWRCFTLEMNFTNTIAGGYDVIDDIPPLTFTAPASVIPTIIPFKGCKGEGCGKKMV